MAQLPCIGLYKPYISLPFGDCAMYFDHYVQGFLYIQTVVQWLAGFPSNHPRALACSAITAVIKSTRRCSKSSCDVETVGFPGVKMWPCIWQDGYIYI